MESIFLTQSTTPIIGQVAWVLGKIMDVIFNILDAIGIPNIGLAIILFTIVINLLMLPITFKQQKFSKLSARMNPEIQAIQKKYKNKKDQASLMAQNDEVREIYAKYGVSPTGTCGYMLIQFPILFALYKVVYAIPAYVEKVGSVFGKLAEHIIKVDNGAFLKNTEVDSINRVVSMYGQSMNVEGGMHNGIIDVLNKLSSTDMKLVAEHYDLSTLTYNGELILSNDTTRGLIDTYNNFLGLDMGSTPQHIMSYAIEGGMWFLVIGALLIPFLSALTQWINIKLMPQQSSSQQGNEQAEAMMASMKTMNNIMPLMSAGFCFTFPCGMGIYWIAGSVVRSIQQVIINKHIDKMDFDKIIQNNSAKSAKKIAKMKETQEKLNSYANIKTKNLKYDENNSYDSNSQNAVKSGSMMEKANMVKKYNEKKK